MPACLIRAATAVAAISLLLCGLVSAAESEKPALDALWANMAQRSAATAYQAARQMIERGDEGVAFLAKQIPGNVQLSRRVPYDKPTDLQVHRAAYVLDCLGSKQAKQVRARISYAPAARFQLYQEKPRQDALGDPLPSGTAFRWGTDRFFVAQNRAGMMAVSDDGKLVAIAPSALYRNGGDVSATIQIMEIATGKIKRELPFIGMRPSLVHFLHDNRHVVYQAEGQIFVVDVASGAITHQFSTNVANLVTFTLADDERTIYTAEADGTLGIFEFPSGNLIARNRIEIAGQPVVPLYTLRLHAAPDFVVAEFNCANGIESRLWDVRRKAWASKKNWGEPPARYALSPDGKRYAVLTEKRAIELRSFADDKLEKELPLKLQVAGIPRTGRERFEFLNAGQLLVTDWTNGSTVVAVDSGKTVWSGRTLSYRAEVCTSADGRFLLGNENGRLQVIELSTGRDLVEAFLARLSKPYFTVSGDGQTVLALRDDHLRQLDPSTLEPLGEVPMTGHPLVLSHDGRFCVMQEPAAVWEPASATQLLALGDLTDGRDPYRRATRISSSGRVLGHRGLVSSGIGLSFHPNGRWLIAEGRFGMPCGIVDLWTAAQRGVPCPAAASEVMASPDGRTCICRDQQNQTWTCCDLASGKPIWRGRSTCYDYSAHAQWFAGGRFAALPGVATLEIRDARDGRIIDMVGGGQLDLRNAAVSPDGGSFALADGSNLRIYERSTRKLMFESPVRGYIVRYLPSGRFVEVTDVSGMTSICDLSIAAAKSKSKEAAAAPLARRWPELAAVDAQEAFAASWAFTSVGDDAVAFLHERMVTEQAVSEKQIGRWIAQLDNDRYELRQAAFMRLLGLGRRVLPQLRQAADVPDSLELQLSLDKLVRSLEADRQPALLPRVGYILRQIGTPAAEELLANLGEYSAQKAFAPQPAPRP